MPRTKPVSLTAEQMAAYVAADVAVCANFIRALQPANYRIRITHPGRTAPVYVGPYLLDEASEIAEKLETGALALPMPFAEGSVRVDVELVALYPPDKLTGALQALADDHPGRNPVDHGVEQLRALRDSLPAGHPDKRGVIRAIEVLGWS